MIHTRRGLDGLVTAPHHMAAEAGADILRQGGNAVEAMVAAAAAIAVVYPHMNSIGGDGFWIVAEPGKDPVGIDASGPAARAATPDFYAEAGHPDAIPARGPLAALTVPGTVSGWAKALDLAAGWGKGLPPARLLEAAIDHAERGVPVTAGQEALMHDKLKELKDAPGFAETYLSAGGAIPTEASLLRQPDLADTLRRLAEAGLDDFYRGDMARTLAKGLEAAGSPLTLADLEGFEAFRTDPLSVDLRVGRAFNMPPPTQGVSALMILALFERLGVAEAEGFDHIHGLVEATKQAFLLRNAHVTDPAYMDRDAADWLAPAFLDERAGRIEAKRALPWPAPAKPGDTIWMGAADKDGRVVSFIQSTFWEFGSGTVPADTGVVLQNRGASFTLDPAHANCLKPGKRPFHTLIPALARLKDGRTLAYGNMGGEGQPQSQAAIFTRHVMFGRPLQEAITAPRWLLGKTWGAETTTLKLENRFDPGLVDALKAAGHDVELLAPFTSTMGHAGAVATRPDGIIEGANDPRSDGAAVAV
jgi:gamma-glutamyltranspeptidase/glutathione hydrolase